MKRIQLIALLVCALLIGCNSDSTDDAESNQSNESKTAENSKTPSASVVNVSDETHLPPPAQTYTGSPVPEATKASSPEDVCKRFMEALQTGNQTTAFQQLTQQAALEMRRAELELEPIGDATSPVTVQEPRFATSKQRIAQVDCQVAGSTITWMLARKSSGWKISGMTVQLEDGGIDLLSFENQVDVNRIKESIDGEPDSSIREAALPDGNFKR